MLCISLCSSTSGTIWGKTPVESGESAVIAGHCSDDRDQCMISLPKPGCRHTSQAIDQSTFFVKPFVPSQVVKPQISGRNVYKMSQIPLNAAASNGDNNRQVTTSLPPEVVQCLENARFVRSPSALFTLPSTHSPWVLFCIPKKP